MAEPGPSAGQILAEWTIADRATDSARWKEGVRRHQTGSSGDPATPGETAELLCSALTHYVENGSLITVSDGTSQETMLAHTIWNVLCDGLRGDGLGADTGRRLRLALAAVRRAGYQPQDLGGSGLMAAAFESGGRAAMVAALSGARPGIDGAPVSLMSWFTGDEHASKTPAAPSGEAAGTAEPGEPPAEVPASGPGSRWDTVKKRAREAQHHVNPVALQHGIESVQGALTEATIAKVDKATGRIKIRKVGVARAALQPTRTLRRAIDGAALTEHLKAYNEHSQSASRDQAGRDAEPGRQIDASSLAAFASCGSKRDYLTDWSRRLVVAAGVPPTEQLIVEHAEMAAAATRMMVFQRLAASHGISDLGQYFDDRKMPEGTALDTFDVLYAKMSEAEAAPQAVDERIIALFNSIWDDWVEGIRERHA